MYLYVLNAGFYTNMEAIFLHERVFTSKELTDILVEYINLKTTDEDRRIIGEILYEGTPEQIARRKNARLTRRIKGRSDLQEFLRNKGFIKIENYASFQCDYDNFYTHGYDEKTQSLQGNAKDV